MKTKTWNGHEVRFVFKGGEWWAVASDVTKALGIDWRTLVRKLDRGVFSKYTIDGGKEVSIIDEYGLYQASPGNPEADAGAFGAFGAWVSETFETLRRNGSDRPVA